MIKFEQFASLQRLSTADKAIQIYAPSKFPFDNAAEKVPYTKASLLGEIEEALKNCENTMPEIRYGVYLHEPNVKAAIKRRQTHYGVKLPHVKAPTKEAHCDLRHMGDLLLFNTAYNIYDTKAAERRDPIFPQRAPDPLDVHVCLIEVTMGTFFVPF